MREGLHAVGMVLACREVARMSQKARSGEWGKNEGGFARAM